MVKYNWQGSKRELLHTVHGYWCPNCKKTVYPKVTEALPNSTQGLSLLIMTAWQTFRKKLGRLIMDAVRLDINKTELSPAIFNRRKMRLYNRLDQLIESPREDKDVNRLIKRLIRHKNELFTFLEYNDVSPYNNHAEQQIRKPVITRKISQQNRSNRAAEAHAIFMSLFRSAELQGLNPVEKVAADSKTLLAGTKIKNPNFKVAA